MPLDLVALRALQDELERLHERCSEQLLRPSEVQDALRSLDLKVRAAIPPDSDQYRLFDRRLKEATDWWLHTVSGYVDPKDCRNIARRIAIIREVLGKTSPEFLETEAVSREEFYFPAGDTFRPRQRLFQLLSVAHSNILVVDQYLDPLVLDLVESLDPGLAVRLLTGEPKRFFVQQCHELQKRRPNLQLRSSTASHDRWILLDGVELWHMGASINGLGKTASRMSRVVSDSERQGACADLESWWASGAVT